MRRRGMMIESAPRGDRGDIATPARSSVSAGWTCREPPEWTTRLVGYIVRATSARSWAWLRAEPVRRTTPQTCAKVLRALQTRAGVVEKRS